MSSHACPKCGHTTLDVAITAWATVDFDPEPTEMEPDMEHDVIDTDHGDLEWDDHSNVICRKCGHLGKLGEFKAPITIDKGSAA